MLSALVPGLGQAWLGGRRRGLLIALPIAGGLVALGAAVALDPTGAIDTILSPGVLATVLVAIVVLAAYHLVAVADAFRLGTRLAATGHAPDAAGRTTVDAAGELATEAPGEPQAEVSTSSAGPLPKRNRAPLSPLLVVALGGVVAFYGAIELVGVRTYQAASAIFVDPSSGYEIPESSFSPRPGPTGTPAAPPTGPVTQPPAPTATPVPVPRWAEDGRLNLLLIGSDAGPGRWLARTDTMIVLSVDIATGRAALFGVPRNLVNVPLPPESAAAFDDGRFPQLLNALYVYAVEHPRYFPGGEAAGFRAISGAIQELIGQRVDGAIVVNLNGFVDLVDAVDGVWVDIPSSVYDAHYPLPDGSGYKEISFSAGCQKLDGERALEYARTRHQDSDYGRMQRQQRVIVAIARQLDPIALLPRVPELLEVARNNLWMTILPNEIADLARLAARVDAGDIQMIRFAPPRYPEYLDTKSIERIRDRVATVFDEPASPSPTPDRTPKPCPRP